MTTEARPRRRQFGAATRMLLPFILIVPVTLLLTMVLQSVGEQITFATLERDGIRYIQALEPLEIALTDAESAAVNGDPADRGPLGRAVDAVTVVDNDLRGQLRTQDRWAGLRAKIESLPTDGTGAAVIAAYGGANDLLLALIDKVRNNSKMIRDPAADTYYLEDGAAQELPEGIAAAARYTDLLITVAGKSAAEQAKALIDINSAGADLAGNARDLSDDVRLAVEGSDSRNLGSALLSKLDRFNRSIDNLTPLMASVTAGKGVVVAPVVRARDEMQAAAADLSAALLAQIDIALRDRISSLGQRRLLAIGTTALCLLLALVPLGLTLAARRRPGRPATQEPGRPATREPGRPATQEPGRPATREPGAARPAPDHPASGAPDPWPREPVPARWAESRSHDTSDSEYARWERFGAPQ